MSCPGSGQPCKAIHVKAKSALDLGANTPAGENLDFISMGFASPSHLIE